MTKSADAGKHIYVTGSNAAYFPMLCLLLASFERFAPGVPLYVCDFGLTEGQANFLKAKGLHLSRPQQMGEGLHPYLYKGTLNDFVRPLDFDVLIWIDSDCVLTGLFVTEVERLIAQHGPDEEFAYVTADLDNNTLGEFVTKNPDKTQPFDAALTAAELPRDNPYLSVCIFILRSKKTLVDWAQLTAMLPPHFLFEQNAFNVVAYKNIKNIQFLDWNTFSVCGAELNNLTTIGGGRYPGSIRLGDTKTLVIHIAATDAQAAISFEPLILPVGDGFLCGLFRFPINADLNQFVIELLAEYTMKNEENRNLLQDSGSLCLENPLLSSGENYAADPRFAHYFTYGNAASKKQ